MITSPTNQVLVVQIRGREYKSIADLVEVRLGLFLFLRHAGFCSSGFQGFGLRVGWFRRCSSLLGIMLSCRFFWI